MIKLIEGNYKGFRTVTENNIEISDKHHIRLNRSLFDAYQSTEKGLS